MKFKIQELLSPKEYEKAANYLTMGGAVMGRAKALKIAKAHGLNHVPKIGYQYNLEENSFGWVTMKHECGKFTIWIFGL